MGRGLTLLALITPNVSLAVPQALVAGAAEQRLYRPHVDAATLACLEVLPWWGPEVAAAARAMSHRAGQPFSTSDWDDPSLVAVV